MDFDDINLNDVYDTLLSMQEKYKLSNIYLLKSNNGYNAFCLSKKTIQEIELMLKEYTFIDRQFIDLALKLRGFFVLRMNTDKIFLDCLKNYNNDELSLAHAIFFKEIMGFEIDFSGKYDDNSIVRIIAFKSKKHGMVALNE